MTPAALCALSYLDRVLFCAVQGTPYNINTHIPHKLEPGSEVKTSDPDLGPAPPLIDKCDTRPEMRAHRTAPRRAARAL